MDILMNSAGRGGQTPSQGAADLIKDSGIDTFVEDVLEASTQVPVIVDFWATWCGPCKTLGPMLERLVKDAKGAVRLVKVDVDKNQELAAQMRVQSIPAVYAFKNGRPVDGFVGAVPESQIKAFIQRLTGGATGAGPSIAEQLEEAQGLLAEGQAELALQLYQQILTQDHANEPALAGTMRCLLKLGQAGAARQLHDSLSEEQRRHADIAAARTALDLAEQMAGKAGGTTALLSKLAINENDHQSRFDLAMALLAEGANEAAVDQLLELYRRDRAWNDEAARKQLLTLFEAFGQADPLTIEARKRLSSLMFA
jgi:putative thioredoxin